MVTNFPLKISDILFVIYKNYIQMVIIIVTVADFTNENNLEVLFN